MKSISKIMLASAVFVMGALSEVAGLGQSQVPPLFLNWRQVRNDMNPNIQTTPAMPAASNAPQSKIAAQFLSWIKKMSS